MSKRIDLINLQIPRNLQMFVNLAANLLAFAVTLGISFFLSPYIVKNLGAEANGFVTLANNFVSYATLVKIALNAVGSRYIIVSYHRGEFEKANKYYSSLFYGDFLIALVSLLVGGLCVWKLENLINVPTEMLLDVKILFAFVFLNFIFNTITTVFSSVPYIKNKVYLHSIRDIQCNFARAVLLIMLFYIFTPKIYFLGAATLLSGIVLIGYNYYYKTKLVPELRVCKEDFSWKYIIELVSQGIWNSLTSLGTMLLTSFDLLIANIFINASEMGVLSVAKSMPAMIEGVGGTLASVFFSEMTIYYAKKDTEGLANVVKQSCMIISAMVTIPLAYLIVFGREFYSLWQPTLDPQRLQVISILTCASLIFCAGGHSIATLFTITLHVKESALSVLITGSVSTIITLLLVRTTSLGVYAVAGVSSCLEIVRTLCYMVPTASRYIGLKWWTFFPTIMRSIISTAILGIFGYFMKHLIHVDNWLLLFVSAFIFGGCGLVSNFIIVLDKSAKKNIKKIERIIEKWKEKSILIY